jgi:hypothetical protein
MKKIIIISVLFLIISNVLLAQVADTTAYLRDSVVAKKSNYIGRPLKNVLTDLRINIISEYAYVQYQKGMADTVKIGRLDFNFHNQLRALQYPELAAVLCIRFVPLKIPSIYFKAGNVLGWLDGWTISKKSFFSDDRFIVTDIELF